MKRAVLPALPAAATALTLTSASSLGRAMPPVSERKGCRPC